MKTIGIKNLLNTHEYGYDFIRCVAILMIVIHHFFTTMRESRIGFSELLKFTVSGSMGFGSIGVALFFILSGALLIYRNKEQFSIKNFYLKRMKRIMVPQWIGFIGAFLLVYITKSSILLTNKLGLLISFFGLNYSSAFWKQFGIQTLWIIGEWFTAVIIIMYLLFPLLRALFIKHRWITTICIFCIFLLNLHYEIFSYHNGYFSITNGLMFFWCGMLFSEYKNIISKYWHYFAVLAILLYILNPQNLFGYHYLITFIFSILLFVSLYQIKISNCFTQYMCKYNYETYLVHHRIYIIFLPMLINQNSNPVQILLAFLFLTGVTFLLSECLQKASTSVSNLKIQRTK